MQVLILAAGDGGRLLPLTATRPKALVPAAGTPLIDRIIDVLAEGGARQFSIVLGYRGEQLREHLSGRRGVAFRFAWNEDLGTGNARSLLIGMRELDPGPFVLCMGDHLLSREIASLALASDGDTSLVFVDRQRAAAAGDGDTLVRMADDGIVLAIGKELSRWDAVDTGMFRLLPDAVGHLRGLPETADLNDAWRELVAERRLRAVDVDGAWWADIDTEADLARAEQDLRAGRNHVIRRAGLAHP